MVPHASCVGTASREPMSIALNESEMDPRLEELLKQASRADGIPVVFVTRSNRPLWLIMPAVTSPDDAHWKTLGSCVSRDKFVARSDQARWLKALGALHNYVEKPFVGHWEVPHTWRVPLGVRLLSRFHGYYVVERFESAAASARYCWTQVSWKNHKLQYRLVTKLTTSVPVHGPSAARARR